MLNKKYSFLLVICLLFFTRSLSGNIKSKPVKPLKIYKRGVPLFGVWVSTRKPKDTIKFFKNMYCIKNKKMIRYAIRRNTIWFLGKGRVGDKWDFYLKKNKLILTNPEMFRYMGRGRYYYFRMRSRKTRLVYRQTFKLHTEYIIAWYKNKKKKGTVKYTSMFRFLESWWYKNGNKQAEYEITKGRGHGREKYWHKNGKLKMIRVYYYGKLIEEEKY